jgi:hypothetical protein
MKGFTPLVKAYRTTRRHIERQFGLDKVPDDVWGYPLEGSPVILQVGAEDGDDDAQVLSPDAADEASTFLGAGIDSQGASILLGGDSSTLASKSLKMRKSLKASKSLPMVAEEEEGSRVNDDDDEKSKKRKKKSSSKESSQRVAAKTRGKLAHGSGNKRFSRKASKNINDAVLDDCVIEYPDDLPSKANASGSELPGSDICSFHSCASFDSCVSRDSRLGKGKSTEDLSDVLDELASARDGETTLKRMLSRANTLESLDTSLAAPRRETLTTASAPSVGKTKCFKRSDTTDSDGQSTTVPSSSEVSPPSSALGSPVLSCSRGADIEEVESLSLDVSPFMFKAVKEEDEASDLRKRRA